MSKETRAELSETDGSKKLEDENSLGDVRFYPPLYTQRYSFAAKILEKHDAKWVVDLGCSECAIVRFYREVPSVQKIQLVDIDREALDFNKNRIKPRPSDYIFKRANPLSIEIYEGSATSLDNRTIGCDAVSMIEFIEHLYPDILEEVEENVFGRLRPRLVVVTTPNYEFNSLFPGELRFRHYDHKFEWIRSEFQSWCQGVCEKYSYSVEYTGIGDPPLESQEVGFCSQAAIFTSSSESKPSIESKECCYCLVAESTFPYKDKDTLSAEETLKSEVSYIINLLTSNHRSMDSDQSCFCVQKDDKEQMEIPVDHLMTFSRISKLVKTDDLKKFLHENGYQLTEDQSTLIIPLEDEWEDRYHDGSEEENETDICVEDSNVNFYEAATSCAIDTEEIWD
ncbi:small RNA 2'-O-methyltransferase-like [Saccostrea cucullata]|uniref:small RNA 2'-O-methyltransferase-like n=1 Tax=Saccostrea cuccullata TaxID=36930 RepID=UPI002ED30FD6